MQNRNRCRLCIFINSVKHFYACVYLPTSRTGSCICPWLLGLWDRASSLHKTVDLRKPGHTTPHPNSTTKSENTYNTTPRLYNKIRTHTAPQPNSTMKSEHTQHHTQTLQRNQNTYNTAAKLYNKIRDNRTVSLKMKIELWSVEKELKTAGWVGVGIVFVLVYMHVKLTEFVLCVYIPICPPQDPYT